MQLETGMSINRYFPAIGTAGLLRALVSGNKRVPRPPPRIKEMTRGITYLLEQIAAVGPKLPSFRHTPRARFAILHEPIPVRERGACGRMQNRAPSRLEPRGTAPLRSIARQQRPTS